MTFSPSESGNGENSPLRSYGRGKKEREVAIPVGQSARIVVLGWLRHHPFSGRFACWRSRTMTFHPWWDWGRGLGAASPPCSNQTGLAVSAHCFLALSS